MGSTNRGVEILTVFAVAAALTACSGSTSNPNPKPQQQPPAPMSAGQLNAGMLPPSDFGQGLYFTPANPTARPDSPGDIKLVTQKADCDQLIFGGDRDAAVASAQAIGMAPRSARGFFERAAQFRPGDAAVALTALAAQGRADCATFTDTLGVGESASNTITVTAKPGLGSQAYLFEQVETFSGMGTAADSSPQVSDTLTVQYGDVLVLAGCFGTQAEARGCDLPAAVQKIARLLKLI